MNPIETIVDVATRDATYDSRYRWLSAARFVWALSLLAFVNYLAFAALDVGRALAFAAVKFSASQQYQLLGLDRARGEATIFDTATGRVGRTPLPDAMQ